MDTVYNIVAMAYHMFVPVPVLGKAICIAAAVSPLMPPVIGQRGVVPDQRTVHTGHYPGNPAVNGNRTVKFAGVEGKPF